MHCRSPSPSHCLCWPSAPFPLLALTAALSVAHVWSRPFPVERRNRPLLNSPNSRPGLLLELPQCTDTLVLSSEEHIERQPEADGGLQTAERLLEKVNITAHVQLTTVALGETFCMLIGSNKTLAGERSEETGKEGRATGGGEGQLRQGPNGVLSMMHTIEYVRLELHYAIKFAYKFAIPAITARCKCDCSGGETICSVEKYQYRNCTSGAVCYRTHRGGQAGTGCVGAGKSEVCCQVEINPYREWTFQALSLKQPSTVVVLRYRIFERQHTNSRNWANTVDETISVPLNQGITKIELNKGDGGGDGRGREDSEHRIEIGAAGGRAHRQMESGMYFYQILGAELDANAGDRLREGVAVNGPAENSLERLGWLRWERGHGWTVRKGLEKITQAQHISVEDCKAQRYKAAFNAEQFVLRGAGLSAADGEGPEEEMLNYDLGSLVREEPWVSAVRVAEREVVVEHAEGVALALTIRTESRPRAVRHSSEFSNFSGQIVLDKESNRYLNLTFHNARGTLIGQIFSSADSLSVMESIFSIDIGRFTVERFQRVVATSVQSPKLVCFYPIGDLEGRLCQRLEFIQEPLQEKPFSDHWQSGHTECIGCNERGVDSVLASLDPRQWLDGLNSPAEFFTCVLELVVCLGLFLASIILVSKCIIPLCGCIRFLAKPAKRK